VTAPTSIFKTFFLTLNIFQHIKIIKKMNEEKPDVVHILDIHPWYMIYWLFLKSKKKFVTINDPQQHSGDGNFLMKFMIWIITKFLLTNADKIITLSKNQVPIIREMGYNQEVIASKLGNQHELSQKNKDIKVTMDEKNILFFGRIVEYKGLKYLLKALLKLKEEKVKFKLTIAGPGDIAQYKKDINKLGPEYVKKDIREIYDEDITKYFKKSAFIVLPYTDATQTGIASIAYSFKKPLIVTKVGSLPEVVINNKTGIIIDPKNINQLAQAIKTMLENPSKTKKMGIEGKKFLEKEYNWKNITKKLWVEVYFEKS
jgi:glycosyltransferase involved in cell wall biosynthesis